MTYRRRKLGDPQTDPPLAPLAGLQLMRADRAASIFTAGDRVLAHGRRVLLSTGLGGAGKWHVSDSAPEDPAIHPAASVSRVAARLPGVPLTPGHFLVLQVVAGPSGQTAIVVGDVIYPTGVVGAVELEAVYQNAGGTSTITKRLDIPGSQEANGAQPSTAGAAWGRLYRRRSAMLMPADLALPGNLASWSEGVTVSLTLSIIGAPRVIHAIVYEVPFAYAGDITAGDWILPLHSDGAGGGLPGLKGARPVERRLAGDAGGGTEILADSARRLREVGPVLWYASTWCESSQGYTATESTARTVTGTTARELLEDTSTPWSEAAAGASLASGANARRVEDSEAVAVFGDRDNAVPVECWIYCRMSAAGPTATVTFAAADYSVAILDVPAGTAWAWRSVGGHLRCGLGAQDPTTCQVFAAASAGGAVFEWRYAAITFAAL